MIDLVYTSMNFIAEVSETETLFIVNSEDNKSIDFVVTIKIYKKTKDGKGKSVARYSNSWATRNELLMLTWVKNILENSNFRRQYEHGNGVWTEIVFMDDYETLISSLESKATNQTVHSFKVSTKANISLLTLKLNILNQFICTEDIVALSYIFNNDSKLIIDCVQKIILGYSFEDAVSSVEKSSIS